MEASESDNPKPSGASRSAQLAASLVELGKIAAALSENDRHCTPPAMLHLSAQDVVDTLLDRILCSMPRGGDKRKGITAETCPFSGLKRNTLIELMDLRDEAGFRTIDWVSMKEDDEAHGTRLYSPGSVLRHGSTAPNIELTSIRVYQCVVTSTCLRSVASRSLPKEASNSKGVHPVTSSRFDAKSKGTHLLAPRLALPNVLQ